jgi:EpsI family protein
MKLWLRNLLLLALMLAASGMAVALRPTQKLAEQGPKIDLEAMIPRAFGEWREEKQSSAQIVDPQTKELIDKIYSQTVARTYVNNNGYRIMLSIAYGGDQSDVMQVHKPEVCYPAQGFTLNSKQVGILAVGNGSIPVTRILTTLGQRTEPVTYWVTIGEQVVQGGVNKKLVEMSYGLSGKIPDGMLVRLSSIDGNDANAFRLHQAFAEQLLSDVEPGVRLRLSGLH